jgi:hypothetical protein
VALDPTARVAPDAVALLIEQQLAQAIRRARSADEFFNWCDHFATHHHL